VTDPIEALARIRAVVNAQAEDDDLWFIAETVSEAYLQRELRHLHAVVESLTPETEPAGGTP